MGGGDEGMNLKFLVEQRNIFSCGIPIFQWNQNLGSLRIPLEDSRTAE